MYLARAYVSLAQDANNAVADCIVELKVNGVIKETFSGRMQGGATPGFGGTSASSYEFAFVGKVAATQIIKLEAVTVDSGVTVNAVLVTFEEDTGASPAIS